LPEKLLIVEHWSAYRFNFHSQKPLTRIRRIFSQGIPVAAVSKSLISDLQDFSGTELNTTVLPNVVDTMLFRPAENATKQNAVLMAGIWKEPKDPESVVADFIALPEGMPELRIAGSGVKYAALQSMVASAKARNIKFLGQLTEAALAEELQNCKALILPTYYETFSVIAAEAAASGVPVLTRQVGALPEVLSPEGAYFKKENEKWTEALNVLLHKEVDQKSIVAQAQRFSKAAVQDIYLRIVDRIQHEA
jgi:glycosyltransferase involved in cell wall biosynthesis